MVTFFIPTTCLSDNSKILSTNKNGGLWGKISMIWWISINGVWFKSIWGILLLFSCFIILASFLANWVFTWWPGLFAITFPLIRVPVNAKSPITSSSLCLAASFAQCKFKLSRIPLDLTLILSFLNAFFNLFMVGSDNSLST